jgi:hypothetical protein
VFISPALCATAAGARELILRKPFFTALKGHSSFSLRSLPAKVGGFHPEKTQKIGQKCYRSWTWTKKPENNARSGLREWGCPDTLIKDVRDVAAAVCNSEGPGRSGEKKLNRPGFQAI